MSKPKGTFNGGKAYRQPLGFKAMIRERDNYTCQLCGKPGYEVDHIIPYAISGDTRPATSRVLCVKCNRATRLPRKDASLPLNEWYAQIERELRGVPATAPGGIATA